MSNKLHISITSEGVLERCVKQQQTQIDPRSKNIQVNLSALEHDEKGIEFFLKKFPDEISIVPAIKDGFLYINKGTFQWLSQECVLKIGEQKFFIARLSSGAVLNRLEEERYGVDGAFLWNDLPFGLTQCALEIDALEVSRKLELPMIWISTHWVDKSGEALNRRGYWITNPLGEMVKSEFSSQFHLESFSMSESQYTIESSTEGLSPSPLSTGSLFLNDDDSETLTFKID